MTPDEVIDPPPEPRPAVPRAPAVEQELAPPPRRRWHGPVGLVLNDAGLKLLALVLAIMMWQLVRGRVETTDTVENVAVEVRDLPPYLRIMGGNRRLVSLTLAGPAGEVRRVKADLVGTTSPLVYRLEDVDAGDNQGTTGSITNPLKFAYPVEGASELVTQINPPLRFEWYRVKEVEVGVRDPELAPIQGRSDVEIQPRSIAFEGSNRVRVTGPVEIVEPLEAEGAMLTPDPVDVSGFLKDPDSTTQYPWSSSFDRWRGKDELKLDDLTTIEPAKVSGRLRLQFVKTEPFENVLVTLPAFGATDADYADWDVEITGGAGAYNPLTRTLRLSFSADERLAKELRTKLASWAFGARLPAPPKEGEKVPTGERLPVFLLWPNPEPAPPVRLDGIVYVTFKKKSP